MEQVFFISSALFLAGVWFFIGYSIGKDKGYERGTAFKESLKNVKSTKELEEDLEILNELEKENEEKKYNQSYGQPEVVDYLDQQYNSGRGVKE